MEQFWLTTHRPTWPALTNVPLMVSHTHLRGRKRFPRALGPITIDSGGFTEVTTYGRYRDPPGVYAAAIARYATEMGNLAWAAPQDWMCEDLALKATGLSVTDHQKLTVANYAELAWTGLRIIPVLQGREVDDYLRCIELYEAAGIDLWAAPVVGVGTICREQHTPRVQAIINTLAGLDLPLHGFGVKLRGLERFGHQLHSADSLAWSYNARRHPPMAGHTGHKNCANCLPYALAWRAKVIDRLAPKEAP